MCDIHDLCVSISCLLATLSPSNRWVSHLIRWVWSLWVTPSSFGTSWHTLKKRCYGKIPIPTFNPHKKQNSPMGQRLIYVLPHRSPAILVSPPKPGTLVRLYSLIIYDIWAKFSSYSVLLCFPFILTSEEKKVFAVFCRFWTWGRISPDVDLLLIHSGPSGDSKAETNGMLLSNGIPRGPAPLPSLGMSSIERLAHDGQCTLE